MERLADIPESSRKTISEVRINTVLTADQCWFGFDHTQDMILLWLARCTTEARIQFRDKLIEWDAELRYNGR